MPPEAVALTLLAALLHALWNATAKRSREPGLMFLSMTLVGSVVTLPWLIGALPNGVPWPAVGLAVASGALEAGYVLGLSYAYRRYDFALVYPVARGSAPLFLAGLAALWLGEHPTPVAAAGIGLIVGGIYLVSLRRVSDPLRPLRERSLWVSLAVGVTIASYSAIDKRGVGLMSPLGYLSLVLTFTALFVLPFFLAGRGVGGLAALFRAEWRSALFVGLASTVTYGIVLLAFAVAPASYVGALRESSVVFAGLLGWWRLREPFGPLRATGVVAVALGAVLIATG